jgi:hypothetical protein
MPAPDIPVTGNQAPPLRQPLQADRPKAAPKAAKGKDVGQPNGHPLYALWQPTLRRARTSLTRSGRFGSCHGVRAPAPARPRVDLPLICCAVQ